MVYILAFKRENKQANGREKNKYYTCSLIISESLFNTLDWKEGDELEFKLEKGKVILRKKR